MKIGELVKKFRVEKNMSTYALSEKTGISQSTISKLENGKRKANLDLLEKIADALEISINRLTGESASSIIEDKLEELGMALTELSENAHVPLHWLENLDAFVPGLMEDVVDRELDWNDTIGDYQSYEWITRVAEVLGIPGSKLRSALARQEIPVYEGPSCSAQEDFTDIKHQLSLPVKAHSTKELLDNYNRLNVTGKLEAAKRVEELTHVKKYTELITLDYLTPIAAHNDDADDEEQQRLMQQDIDEL